MTTNPINRACLTGDLALVRQTVGNGHRPDIYSLDYAINTANPDIVQIVCHCGATPTTDTLSRACLVANQAIVNFAVAAGAMPDSDTLTNALNTKNHEIVRLVSGLGAVPNEASLEAAVRNGSVHFVPSILKSIKNPSDQLVKISWVGPLSKDETDITARAALGGLIEQGGVFPPVYSSRFALALQAIKRLGDKHLLARGNLVTSDDFDLLKNYNDLVQAKSDLGKNSQYYSGTEYHNRWNALDQQTTAIFNTKHLFDQNPYPPPQGSVAATMRSVAPASSNDCTVS